MVQEPGFWQRLLAQTPSMINSMGAQYGDPELSPYVQMAGQAMNPIIADPSSRLQLKQPSGQQPTQIPLNQQVARQQPTRPFRNINFGSNSGMASGANTGGSQNRVRSAGINVARDTPYGAITGTTTNDFWRKYSRLFDSAPQSSGVYY